MRSLVDLVHTGAAGAPTVYGKRSLIALSHAMEDRGIAAGGPPPLVFGGFQRARLFAHDRGRYLHISAGSALTVAVGPRAPRSPSEPSRPGLRPPRRGGSYRRRRRTSPVTRLGSDCSLRRCLTNERRFECHRDGHWDEWWP